MAELVTVEIDCPVRTVATALAEALVARSLAAAVAGAHALHPCDTPSIPTCPVAPPPGHAASLAAAAAEPA